MTLAGVRTLPVPVHFHPCSGAQPDHDLTGKLPATTEFEVYIYCTQSDPYNFHNKCTIVRFTVLASSGEIAFPWPSLGLESNSERMMDSSV